MEKFLVRPKKQHGELLYTSGLYLANLSGIFTEPLQGYDSSQWTNAGYFSYHFSLSSLPTRSSCAILLASVMMGKLIGAVVLLMIILCSSCATLVEPCFTCSAPDHSYKWLIPWSTISELASTKIKTSLLHNLVSSVTVDGQTCPAPVCITELVGTVGDMETMLFIEAVHQLSVSLLVKVVLHSSVACSLKPSIQWVVASDFEDASATSTLDAHATSWKTYMLPHWNSCRQSAMTRAFCHVSASEPIRITFQLFAMSLELAFNHVANGHRVLLILGHYDAPRHSVLWACTTALLVAADHSWDVPLFLSMHPSSSFDTVQSLFAANMSEELVSPAAVAIWWFTSAPCKYLVAFRLYTHFHDSCTYTGELWNEVMASSNSIQYVALKYMKFWWFTTAIWTEFTGSIFNAGFSLQIGATCSLQPCLLLTHAYQLSVLAPTVLSLAWGNQACNSKSGTTVGALQDEILELWVLFVAFCGGQGTFQRGRHTIATTTFFKQGRHAIATTTFFKQASASDKYYHDSDDIRASSSYHLGTVFDLVPVSQDLYFALVAVYPNSSYCIKDLQLQWDPGGFTVMLAWGQAESQGGRGVRNPSNASSWASTWAFGADLGPSLVWLGNYKYPGRPNDNGIQKDHGGETALSSQSPSSISHPLSSVI